MHRISPDHLAAAITAVRSMSLEQKGSLADEILAEQRNLLASVLVQSRFDVSESKVGFLIEILLICYQAMKETGLKWLLISEADQEYQMEREAAILKHFKTLDPQIAAQFAMSHFERHPEGELLAFVCEEIGVWLAGLQERGEQEESDLYVILAAVNLVNCIGYADVEAGSRVEPTLEADLSKMN